MQQGDVLLFQSINDGDIAIENGITKMTTGLETAVYLSLFSPEDWFGNYTVDTDNERMQSRTDAIIIGKPQSSKNYQLLAQAAELDLKWLVDTGNADEITTQVYADKLNRVNIIVTIVQDSNTLNLTIPIEWGNNGG